MGKVLWYDGEFYHSHTVNNRTYPLFVQVGWRVLIIKEIVWVFKASVIPKYMEEPN